MLLLALLVLNWKKGFNGFFVGEREFCYVLVKELVLFPLFFFFFEGLNLKPPREVHIIKIAVLLICINPRLSSYCGAVSLHPWIFMYG